MSNKTAPEMIIEAYSRDTEKVAITLSVFRTSRKYGFPIVNSIQNKSEEEQFLWAVRFLLSIADTWPLEDFPIEDKEFKKGIDRLLPGTKLYEDAKRLLGDANGNIDQLEILSQKA